VKVAPSIYDFTTGLVRLSIADVTAHSGRLDAWVEVFAGTKRVTYGDYNLRGARTVSSLARACTETAPSVKVNWLEWLAECCYQVIHDTLEGDPPVELVADNAQAPGWIVEHLVGDVGATSLVGFGETGKSLLALAVACTVASGQGKWLGLKPLAEGPVFYIDYEAGAPQHEWRLAQLARHFGQSAPKGIHYRREGLPLARSVASIARHAGRLKAKLLIVDSVMLARGGDAFGPETTTQLYSALSQIGLPALLVDHRAKHAQTNGDSGPYGSVANLNSLRLCWGVSTLGVPGGADIKLRKVKANYHGNLRPHAWQLRFTDDNREAHFCKVDEAAVLPGGEASLKDRVLGALQRVGYAGLPVRGIAAEVGATEGTVRTTLGRLKREGLAATVGGVWVADAGQEEAPF
jgi:hypothetical protein